MKKIAAILGTVVLGLGVFAIPAFADTTTNQATVGMVAMQSIMSSGTMQKAMTTGDFTQMASAMNTPEIKAIMGEQHVNQMTNYMKNGMMGGTYGNMMGGSGSTSIFTPAPANVQQSQNWAGYVDTPQSGSYTSITGTWMVPDITSSQQDAASAQWVGLGGASSSDLLQMGTTETIENGQQINKLFWEKLPSPATDVVTVPTGATVTVDIAPSTDPTQTSVWNLTYTITPSGGQAQTGTIPVTLDSDYIAGIGTSAEWISEDPSTYNNQLYPLANMGTINYQSATVNGGAINATGNNVEPFELGSTNGSVLLVPSALGSDGKSFSTGTPAQL
ncbi:G1 family glutamic endopeptidase [Desulfosporosinus sp. FKA]|uniref:G1 family glutamic endopeptidase n=1 Tax=Desulfosporosinus sp. FKA TaxID=1969834 RepID=UPI001FA86743|nr:G1 family glutamic endopeptidase [Desulfosporosinus sp. FKA]